MVGADGGARTRLIILFGGQSPEHDVSCVTARHVLQAVHRDRYDVVAVGITPDGRWVVQDEGSAILSTDPDGPDAALSPTGESTDPLTVLAPVDHEVPVVVLPLLHGPRGEDGTVQGLLELADVPYVGSGVLGSALGMDKVKAKEVTAFHGIPQARFTAVRLPSDTDEVVDLTPLGGFPVFVKPANMGSSIGVSKAHDDHELRAALELAGTYDEWVLVEEAVVGREIEVAVLGNRDPVASVPGEVRSASEFYDYEDKYLDGRAELLIPAPLAADATERVRALALEAYRALRGEGLARVDFFYEPEGRGFLLNEINTIPGFTPFSMYPKLWEASGLPYADLIDRLVELAADRHRRRHSHRTASRRSSIHRELPPEPDVSGARP